MVAFSVIYHHYDGTGIANSFLLDEKYLYRGREGTGTSAAMIFD